MVSACICTFTIVAGGIYGDVIPNVVRSGSLIFIMLDIVVVLLSLSRIWTRLKEIDNKVVVGKQNSILLVLSLACNFTSVIC